MRGSAGQGWGAEGGRAARPDPELCLLLLLTSDEESGLGEGEGQRRGDGEREDGGRGEELPLHAIPTSAEDAARLEAEMALAPVRRRYGSANSTVDDVTNAGADVWTRRRVGGSADEEASGSGESGGSGDGDDSTVAQSGDGGPADANSALDDAYGPDLLQLL